MTLEDHIEVIRGYTPELTKNLSVRFTAFNGVLDHLHQNHVMEIDQYQLYQLNNKLDQLEKEDRVRKFIHEFLMNQSDKNLRRFTEFYTALKKLKFKQEFKKLTTHKSFRDAERTMVSSCSRVSTQVTAF